MGNNELHEVCTDSRMHVLDAIIDNLEGLGTDGAIEAATKLREYRNQWVLGDIDTDELAQEVILIINGMSVAGM